MRNKGFTLIELLVVLAILGVLAAIIIPDIVDFMNSDNVTDNETIYINDPVNLTDSELVKIYQRDIYNLEKKCNLYREELLKNNIKPPVYKPLSPNITINEQYPSLLIYPHTVSDYRFNWTEVFNSIEETNRYIAFLKSSLEPLGCTISVPNITNFDNGMYPMIWNMSANFPGDTTANISDSIYTVLESLGAWNDIRITDEFWRD